MGSRSVPSQSPRGENSQSTRRSLTRWVTGGWPPVRSLWLSASSPVDTLQDGRPTGLRHLPQVTPGRSRETGAWRVARDPWRVRWAEGAPRSQAGEARGVPANIGSLPAARGLGWRERPAPPDGRGVILPPLVRPRPSGGRPGTVPSSVTAPARSCVLCVGVPDVWPEASCRVLPSPLRGSCRHRPRGPGYRTDFSFPDSRGVRDGNEDLAVPGRGGHCLEDPAGD